MYRGKSEIWKVCHENVLSQNHRFCYDSLKSFGMMLPPPYITRIFSEFIEFYTKTQGFIFPLHVAALNLAAPLFHQLLYVFCLPTEIRHAEW